MTDPARLAELREKLNPLVLEHTRYKRWLTKFENALGVKRNGEQQKIVNERSLTVGYRNWMNFKIDEVGELLSETEKSIKNIVKELPTWTEHYCNVKGIAHLTIGYLEAKVDLEIATKNGKVVISKVQRHCGYGNSEDRQPGKGNKRQFDKGLKTQIYTTGLSLMQSRNTIGHKYGIFYDNRRTRTSNSEKLVKENQKGGGVKEVMWKDAKKQHQMDDAIRIMLKEVIKDYVLIRAELEGRKVRPPYAEEYLGKKHSA